MQVPFFKDAERSFITQVVTVLKICHFLPEDIIIEQGSAGDNMYFIESGVVDVSVQGKTVANLHAGQFFGGLYLLMRNMHAFW
jgi:signal-transduction protein with cAMP-binding, CBS, and nucleotidyltransferase domain